MFEWTRSYLLEQIQPKPLDQLKQVGVLPGKDASKQWQVLNHYLTELYLFMNLQNFSVEEKAALLNLTRNIFVESFAGKLTVEQSRDRLHAELNKIGRVVPGNPSPLLRSEHHDRLLKYLQTAFFSLYQFYGIAYVEYIDYNLLPWQPPNSQQPTQHKLVLGKVIPDPSKVAILSEFVSESRPAAEQPAKQKKK